MPLTSNPMLPQDNVMPVTGHDTGAPTTAITAPAPAHSHPAELVGFWDKNTVICAGAMPYRPDFPATTRIQARSCLQLAC